MGAVAAIMIVCDSKQDAAAVAATVAQPQVGPTSRALNGWWRLGECTEAGARGDPIWRSGHRLMRVTTIDRAATCAGDGSLGHGHELRPLLTGLLVRQLAGDDSRRTVAPWPARVPDR